VKEFTRTITSKGRVTIPADVGKHLRLGPHATVSFVLEDDGTVRLIASRYTTVASVAGAAGKLGKPLSWRKMRDIAREDAVE
jgi:bifunctional DNA-binding transcriptional regulator/antitoxin component of YhaV-PrlF toxin-antitoxin module